MTDRPHHHSLLCIGGPLDGKYRSSPAEFFQEQDPVPSPDFGNWTRVPGTATVTTGVTTYKRGAIWIPDKNFFFWAPESQTIDHTLALLFSAYSRGRYLDQKQKGDR